jgi:hypothetical protein
MTTTSARRPARRRTDVWQLASLGLSLLASLLLLVLPVYSSATSSSDGPEVTTTSTLLEVNGPGVLVILAVPVLLMLLPLYARRRARRWVSLACTLVLAAGALLGLASIGLFYLPALVCSVAATTAAMSEAPPAA